MSTFSFSSIENSAALRGLPILEALPKLREILDRRGWCVLRAQTGAGKSTVVPLALLGEAWAEGKRIYVLQPRRLAAQALARRLAEITGTRLGELVGYRTGLDSRTGPSVRVEVLSEGILPLMLLDRPDIDEAACLIFDEFHERSAQADLGLAFALESVATLRPDLRLLVMSASLEASDLTALLRKAYGSGDAGRRAPKIGGKDTPEERPDTAPEEEGLLDVEGRLFPVEVTHLPPPPGSDYWRDRVAFLSYVARVCRRAAVEEEGVVLCFLPGLGEINEVFRLLTDGPGLGAEASALAGESPGKRGTRSGPAAPPPGGAGTVEILRLAASLPPEEQARVFLAPGGRRIVLSTSIAQTSLTLPGVTLVVDAGLSRTQRFDPRLEMDRLVSERISQASSLQRAGRAGRLRPGVVWKLWEAGERLEAQDSPEIERVDLAPFVLACQVWHDSGVGGLGFASPPSPALLGQASELLESLGALEAGRATALGRAMKDLRVHPRFAKVLLALKAGGASREETARAALVFALLEEGDRYFRNGDGDFASSLARAEEDLARADNRRSAPGDASGRLEKTYRRTLDALFSDSGPERGADDPSDSSPGHRSARKISGPLQGPKTKNAGDASSSADTSVSRILTLAFPERVGRRLSSDQKQARYELAGGRQAILTGPAAKPDWLVAADLDGGAASVSRILVFSPLRGKALEEVLAGARDEFKVDWEGLTPRPRHLKKLGRLVLGETALASGSAPRGSARPSPADAKPRHGTVEAAIAESFLKRLADEGMNCLPWDGETRNLLARMRFCLRFGGAWHSGGGTGDRAKAPDSEEGPTAGQAALRPESFDDGVLLSEADLWLRPFFEYKSACPIVDPPALRRALEARFGYGNLAGLDSRVPARLTLPGGRSRPIDYGKALEYGYPRLEARLQEFFGLKTHPTVLGIPLALELLSPAQRPLQVSRDILSFWSTSYRDVRKDMRGRYPKHPWPEDPLLAEAGPGPKPKPGSGPEAEAGSAAAKKKR